MEPTLTAEQVERGKKFSPEEVQRYNRARISGSDPVTAFNYALGTKATETPKNTDGLFTGENSLGSAFSRAGTQIAEGVGRIAQDVQGIDPIQLITNPRAALSRATLRGAGTAGRAVGEVIGGVVETADDLLTGGAVGRATAPVVQSAIESPLGQRAVETAVGVDRALDGIPGDILAASELLLPPGITIAGRNVARTIGGQVARTADTLPASSVRETFAEAIPDITPLRDLIPSRVRESVAGTVEAAQDTLVPGRRAGNVLERARTAGVENVDETILRNAVDRGFAEDDAVLFATLTQTDKEIGRQLVELAENATVDKRALYGSRPIDVVGQNMVRPINELKSRQAVFGREVNEVAQNLKGKSVSGENIQERIQDILDESGITGAPGSWDFSGSRFEFVPEMQARIGKTLDNIVRGVENGDAFAVHNLKKAIDEAVDYAKTQEGLTGSAQNLIKSFRRAIDDELDSTFPEYNRVNSQFADLQDFIDDVEAIFGRGREITNERAANRLRSVFSNVERRGDIKDFIARLDEYTQKYGIERAGNLYDQVLLTEILERMYGTQAITSLQGEVQKAVRGAQTLANIARDPLRGAGEVLAGGIETITGQTDAARRAFLRDLFSSP